MMLEQLDVYIKNHHPCPHHLDIDLIPFTKIVSKLTTDLNEKHTTIKCLEENRGEKSVTLSW